VYVKNYLLKTCELCYFNYQLSRCAARSPSSLGRTSCRWSPEIRTRQQQLHRSVCPLLRSTRRQVSVDFLPTISKTKRPELHQVLRVSAAHGASSLSGLLADGVHYSAYLELHRFVSISQSINYDPLVPLCLSVLPPYNDGIKQNDPRCASFSPARRLCPRVVH
jgi:hypothetical protein